MAALYVVATPIGNLQDFSPRAVETMKTADLIIAEDTRVTMKLCQVFGLKAPLVSCHRHSEDSKAAGLAQRILEGPCISDPGNEVVRACAAAGIQVIPVPGCCAGIAALSVSGADAREFTFYGFLPREKKDLREKLREISKGTRVAVVHESPFRITELTEAITETLPEAELTVCCDLTKMHEKTVYGKSADVLAVLKAGEKTEKGEYCVVIDLHNVPVPQEETPGAELSAEAKLIEIMKQGKNLREAQEALIEAGEKKNAVKQAAILLRRMFNAV